MQKINEIPTRLEEKDEDIIHYIVLKPLWVEKGGMTDIDGAILLLCIRATKSTKEDKAKLRKVLQYLKQTINYKRIMEEYRLSQLYTWLDTSYALQPNKKSHTRGCK